MTLFCFVFVYWLSCTSAFRIINTRGFSHLHAPLIINQAGHDDITSNHRHHHTSRASMRQSMRLYAAKKKKKKKVLKAGGAATTGNGGGSQSAVRVSNQMNVSVRKQIQWAKALKRLNTNAQGGRVHKSKVRKERAPKKEVEEYVEIDYENTPPPVVFVDGYNIIFYINSVEGRDIHLGDARDCLIADLGVLASATGWYIECVFDAYNNPGTPAGSRNDQDGCIVVYTSMRETADTYIERRFQELTQQHKRPNMVVATDDLVLRSSASSMGGDWLTADMLLQEFRIAYTGWEIYEQQTQEMARMAKPRLGDSLAKELRQSLRSMMIEEGQQVAMMDIQEKEDEEMRVRSDGSHSNNGGGDGSTTSGNGSDGNPRSTNYGNGKKRQKAVAVTAANMDDIIRAMQAEQRGKE